LVADLVAQKAAEKAMAVAVVGDSAAQKAAKKAMAVAVVGDSAAQKAAKTVGGMAEASRAVWLTTVVVQTVEAWADRRVAFVVMVALAVD